MIFKKTVSNKNSLATKRLWLSNEEKKYLDTQHEHEILKFSEGLCFGEWGLLYNIPRTASAMSIDDSILFSIEKEDFDKALSVRNKIFNNFFSNFVKKSYPF
jgi:CRP-like cAMP-binding protein